jgi:hypothetical protein
MLGFEVLGARPQHVLKTKLMAQATLKAQKE